MWSHRCHSPAPAHTYNRPNFPRKFENCCSVQFRTPGWRTWKSMWSPLYTPSIITWRFFSFQATFTLAQCLWRVFFNCSYLLCLFVVELLISIQQVLIASLRLFLNTSSSDCNEGHQGLYSSIWAHTGSNFKALNQACTIFFLKASQIELVS